jgi:predicted DNA-binding transcriptional regulator AlpA
MAYRIVRASDLPSIEGRADDELLTIEEAAAYVGLSPATLNNWRTGVRGVRGGPPWIPLHDGPKSPVRYRVGDVRAWLASRVVHPSEGTDTPARVA